VRRVLVVPPVLAIVMAACGPAPSPSASVAPTPPASVVASFAPTLAPPASPSSATGPRELTAGSAALPAGTYTKSGFLPRITFAVDDGWFAGTVTDGFFDIQQDQGTPDVIAVQFARVDGIVGAEGSMTTPATAAAAAKAIRENPGLVVIGESASRLGGLDGLTVEVENRGGATAPVMRVSAGTLSFDPKRRLWISLFDTPDGVVAVMVGGSVATWDNALAVAEPVLESVVIEP
jgi:hypothetical protein